MRCAFVLFDRLTALDFIGVYDPLTRLHSMNILSDFEWSLCSLHERVTDDRGLVFTADRIGQSLSGFDLLIVPGGYGSREMRHNKPFLDWLLTAVRVPLKASVCTGALLLGAAGFLKGRRATTHPNAIQDLASLCSEVVLDRVMDDGEVVTSGGVTAAIDLGLYLVERIAGPGARAVIATQMDYPYGRD